MIENSLICLAHAYTFLRTIPYYFITSGQYSLECFQHTIHGTAVSVRNPRLLLCSHCLWIIKHHFINWRDFCVFHRGRIYPWLLIFPIKLSSNSLMWQLRLYIIWLESSFLASYALATLSYFLSSGSTIGSMPLCITSCFLTTGMPFLSSFLFHKAWHFFFFAVLP